MKRNWLKRRIGVALILCSAITAIVVPSYATYFPNQSKEAANYTVGAKSYSELQKRLQDLINKYNNTAWTSTGNKCEKHGTYKDANNVLHHYTCYSKYYYGHQCKGFASYIFNELFCGGYIGAYSYVKNNVAESYYYIPAPVAADEVGKIAAFGRDQTGIDAIKRLISQSKPGDFLQTRRRDSDWGHSMIIVGFDDNGVYLFDCNSDGQCGVQKYHQTWSEFVKKNEAMSIYRSTRYPGDAPDSPDTPVVIQTALDSPAEGENIASDTFRIIGWVKSADVREITYSINGGTEHPLKTYWREDVQGTGFLADLYSYQCLGFNSNSIKVTAYLNDGTIIDVGTRQVVRYAAFALDTPTENMVLSEEKFKISGWVYSEYSGWDIDRVSAVINGETEVKLNMYTREDVAYAKAFLGSSYLEYGNNMIEIIVHYTNGYESVACKRYVTYYIPTALDGPSEGENIASDTFRIIGWVKSADVREITYSINGGTEHPLKTYWREDVQGTGFLADLYSYQCLGFNLNSIKVTAYLNNGAIIDVGTRQVVRYAAFALDTPTENMAISEEKFKISGWVYSEYSGWDIDRVSAVINGETEVKLNMYTREDIAYAKAFLGTFPTSSYLEYGNNVIEIIVHYTNGYESVASKSMVKSQVLPHKHSYERVVTAPTCTEQGYTTCTCTCGDSYMSDYVDAIGHSGVVDPAVEATCTRQGLTEGKHCGTCNAVLKKQETIPVRAHSYSKWNKEDEEKHVRKCSACSAVQRQNHLWENGACTVCVTSGASVSYMAGMLTVSAPGVRFDCQIIIACYNAQGQQVVLFCPEQPVRETVWLETSVAEQPAVVKVFYLDTGWRPVCPGFEYSF